MSDRDRACESLVYRWVGNPDEPERAYEPCGRPAKWRVKPSLARGIAVCTRHANFWRRRDDLRSLIEATVEPLS